MMMPKNRRKLYRTINSFIRNNLFKVGDAYVLPEAQTYVSPSEIESHIYLKVRTTRPPKSGSYPENQGHEESLTRLIKAYEFSLKISGEYNFKNMYNNYILNIPTILH